MCYSSTYLKNLLNLLRLFLGFDLSVGICCIFKFGPASSYKCYTDK